MFRRLFSNVVEPAPSAPANSDPLTEAARQEIETLPFVPMVPLQPPRAQNDDPLQDFCGGVEQDLRAAGYLR